MARKRGANAAAGVVSRGELVEVKGKPHGQRGSAVLDEGQLVELPPILAGNYTLHAAKKVRSYYLSIAEIFERWVTRRDSPHTQRAYRQDFMSLVEFLGIVWPIQATRLFQVTVADVQAWKDDMLAQEKAPKTINRRVSSVSSFFKYLGGGVCQTHSLARIWSIVLPTISISQPLHLASSSFMAKPSLA